ncbi:MAG: SH3 domain-containing protein [Mesorhizobium sp.]|nr:SH3 domain-containing protein [Mesorhizobium sp.]
MAGLALPKLRWLVIGAVAVGIWVVREDMKNPRPPEKVQADRAAAKPRPTQPVGVKSAGSTKTTATATPEKPVPPKSLTGKTATNRTLLAKNPQSATSDTIALVLPKTVDRPPSRPQKIVTGSISRPDKPVSIQTKARVRLRAQARPDAAVIATLEPGTVMRELVRDGDWLLVMGDGRKGWVRGDYVEASSFLKRRPKLPVADVPAKTP